MTEYSGLPVAGYRAQSQETVDAVNENKEAEEVLLRRIESLRDNSTLACDPRMIALAITALQESFMWLNRALMKPGRVRLPEDAS